MLKVPLTLFLVGSAASAATCWASAVSSLVWAESVSNCLRACALDSSMERLAAR